MFYLTFTLEEEMFKRTDHLLYSSKILDRLAVLKIILASIGTSASLNETWSLQAVFILYM